jgi:hypothetical protein
MPHSSSSLFSTIAATRLSERSQSTAPIDLNRFVSNHGSPLYLSSLLHISNRSLFSCLSISLQGAPRKISSLSFFSPPYVESLSLYYSYLSFSLQENSLSLISLLLLVRVLRGIVDGSLSLVSPAARSQETLPFSLFFLCSFCRIRISLFLLLVVLAPRKVSLLSLKLICPYL